MKKLYTTFSFCIFLLIFSFTQNAVAQIPEISVTSPNVAEGVVAVFNITLSNPFSQTLSVYVTTTNLTASDVDYNIVQTSVNIPQGTTNVTVLVQTNSDSFSEPNETFKLTVHSPYNNSASGICTIFDNPILPLVNVSNGIANEGASAVFQVTLSEPSSTITKINVQSGLGTAGNGVDFMIPQPQIIIQAGATAVNYIVPTIYDIFSEGPETFSLILTVATTNTLNTNVFAQGLIRDNQDLPLVFLSQNLAATEGTSAVFTVCLSNPSSKTTTFTFAVNPQTADSNDYIEPQTNYYTIPAGSTQVTIPIAFILDAIYEDTENFTAIVTLTSNNTHNTQLSATGTIINNPIFISTNPLYTDFNNDGFTNVGDVINFTYTLLNAGNQVLTNIGLHFNQLPLGASITSFPVAASNTNTFSNVRILNQDDINSNFVVSTITANATENSLSRSTTIQNRINLNLSKGFKLNAFIDTNGNGFQDAQEVNFANGTFKYQMNNGVVHNIFSSTGIFYLYEVNSSNLYTFSYINNNTPSSCYGQFNIMVPTYTNITIGSSGIVTYNFALTPAVCADLAVYLSNYNEPPRPGFVYKNYISYKNQGNQTIATGVVTFAKSNTVSILSTSPVTTPVVGGFTYNFSNLLPGEIRYILVSMQMPTIPTVALGQIVTNAATISVPTTDINTNNNNSTLSQVIVGSYDPNDKAESRGPKILHSSFTANDYLNYKIQFENTGTAAAINVKVTDALSNKLDETTLQMIDASHSYVLDRTGSNLEWKFSGIDLPPSVANTEIGHGYVVFQIKPKVGYVIGDIIQNTANIYFDFNPAIVTNTWTTEFVATLNTSSFGIEKLRVYPNPSSNILHIECQNKISSVIFSNILGQTVLSKSCNDLSTQTDISNFAKGVYFVRIKAGSAEQTVKILKE